MATIPTPEITQLLTRYREGEPLAETEASLLAGWLQAADADLFAGAVESLLTTQVMTDNAAAVLEAKLDALQNEDREEYVEDEREAPVRSIHRIHFIRRFKWIAAAVIVFAIAGGAWFWMLRDQKTSGQTLASVYHNDVAPGKKGGKLKLSKLSGEKLLSIDSLKDGFIINDGGVELYKQGDKIIYKGAATATAYNEIIEGIGEYTKVELPDRSTAWVNTNSSIRYPLQFASNERKITMTGEAAFSVVHNESQPFRVYADNQVFEDKGTVFNIRAYKGEPVIRTTVREGLVKIGNTMIRPRQQALVARTGQVSLNENVNLESVFAWIDGQFSFASADITEIMNEASKWYGVEVVYQDKIDRRFDFVGIDRNMPISNLLRNLETIGGVHFDVEGKKVTVRK